MRKGSADAAASPGGCPCSALLEHPCLKLRVNIVRFRDKFALESDPAHPSSSSLAALA